MAGLANVRRDLTTGGSRKVVASEPPSQPLPTSEITRLLSEDNDSDELYPRTTNHSTYHIYTQKECYKLVTPILDATKERRSGPTIAQQKVLSADKRERIASGLPPVEPNSTAFFLHRPYLAFHIPPLVLYTGTSKHYTTPAVLIHQGPFWRSYKLQLISAPGILDPRGVVPWKHNGGDKTALKNDDRKLKGYKVRTWRLWGETGKDFVHCVKRSRATGEALDPDLPIPPHQDFSPARADEVVHLHWTSPLSLHTRHYHFSYRGLDFAWKGTGTVKESRRCGMLLRFNHLKLVAKLPLEEKVGGEQSWREVCLGRFTSSVAAQKNGTLELYDVAMLRVVDEYMPEVLVGDPFEDGVDKRVVAGDEIAGGETSGQIESEEVVRLKKSTLYQVIIATAMCMIKSEKEKRHTVLDFLMQAGEGGGGGG